MVDSGAQEMMIDCIASTVMQPGKREKKRGCRCSFIQLCLASVVHAIRQRCRIAHRRLHTHEYSKEGQDD
jgi:hypothetical protein